MSIQHTSLSPTYDPNYEKNQQYQSKMIDTAGTVYKKSEVSSPQRSPNLARDYDYPQDTGMMKGTIISRLKHENEQLKRHVKDLNTKLTEHVKALALKVKVHSESEGPADEVMKRQLQNAYKQIDIYKKQLEIFEYSETQELLERVKKLETLMSEKDLRIEVLTHERKILERINRDQDREIGGYKNSFGFEKRINQYYDEVKCLRDKISNMLAVNRHNEQNFRKQQKFLVSQTLQYRILCEVVGISAGLNFKSKEELEEAISINVKNELSKIRDANETFALSKDPSRGLHKLTLSNKRSSVSLKSVPTSKTHRKLEGGMSSPEEDKLRKDVLVLQSKILALEAENKKVTNKLKEKEREDQEQERDGGETSSRTSIFETKRNAVRHRSLNRINHVRADSQISQTYHVRNQSAAVEGDYSPVHRKEIPTSSNEVVRTNPSVIETIAYEEQIRSRRGDVTTPNSQSPQRKTKQNTPNSTPTPQRDGSPKKPPVLTLGKEIGGRIGSGLLDFNDREHISNVFTSKIAKIVLWSDDSYVYGIQAFYNMQNSFVIAGDEHIGQGMKKIARKVSTLEIDEDDRIFWIYGRYTDGLTYLRMKTSSGKIIEAGNKDLPQQQKKFRIVLDENENFAVLSGAHFSKIDDDDEEEPTSPVIILANIGFTVVKAVPQE